MNTTTVNPPALKLSEAREKITALALRAEQILDDGRKLDLRFKKMFDGGQPALRFVRYRDRSLVIYRWRSFGRGSKPVDLLSEEGQALLLQQPVAVRQAWLEFEEERLRLNLEYGLVEYQRKKLESWVQQQERLKKVQQAMLG